jgi:hypothetical protein
VFTFTVRPETGEPFEIKATTRDVLVWEEAGRDRSMAGLVSDMHMKDLYWIAHCAARRQALFNGPLDEFKKTMDLDISKVLEMETPDPTQQAP